MLHFQPGIPLGPLRDGMLHVAPVPRQRVALCVDQRVRDELLREAKGEELPTVERYVPVVMTMVIPGLGCSCGRGP